MNVLIAEAGVFRGTASLLWSLALSAPLGGFERVIDFGFSSVAALTACNYR